jgi:cyclophilin family peptidyl-prolyl cis-trans isomerase
MWDHVSNKMRYRKYRKASRVRAWPAIESLEGRLVLDAALASLPNISVPAFQGDQVVLDGSASGLAEQTYTVTSSNPAITATVAQGEFLTMNVAHHSSGTGDPAFSGNIVIQLFGDLTPKTAATIEGFINSGFYNNKDLFRVANGFPDANSYIIQGGSPNNLSSGTSGLPGTPFPNEIVPQLAFTNPGQLAMANAGQPDSNDTQFFLTTGAPSVLDNNYTIFGQVVSGLNLVDEMTQVTLTSDPVSGADTYPVSPIVVNTETLSTTNPDGVLHIDTTAAPAGQTATITVTATDPTTDTTQSQSFKVTVVPSSAVGRPTANAQSVTTAVGTARAITLTGTDPDTPPLALTYNVTAGPAHGTLSGTAPNLTYTPDSGYFGPDSFQFTAGNGTLISAPTTVGLTVVGPPTANAQAVTTAVGTPTAITLAGTDPNTPPLALTYTVTTGPTHGTLSGTAPNLTYTPATGYFGPDSFQFTARNGTLTSTPATVALAVVTQPTANAQSVTAAEGTARAITLTGTDTDTPPLALTYTVTASPAHGTLSGTAPNLTYTPDSGYFGPDSFQFTDNNGTLTSAPATVTITVVGPPAANAQSVSTGVGVPTAITLTGTDPNTPPLALTYTVTTGPTHGTLSGAAPNLTYTPATGYFGPDTFQFTVSNGALTSAPATVALSVVAQPTANAQSVTTAVGTPTAITLTGTDPDTPPLALTYTVTIGPAHGTLSGTAPNLTYTPATSYFGPDSFQFTARNGTLTSTPATVALAVVTQPTANAQSVTAAEGTARAITLTGIDPDTPPLALTYNVTASPVHGTLSGTAPNLTYTPASGYFGPDSFQFTDSNGTLTSAPATVTITVVGPPAANAQAVSTAVGTAAIITLTGTDPDTPPLALTYTVTASPAHGTLSGAAPNLTYTPAAGYFGPDGFQFTVSNGTLFSAPATVALAVVGPPTANAQAVTTLSGTARAITLTGNDPNTPPLALNYTVTTGPAHGTLSGTAPNLIYTPATGYYGTDSLQFTVTNSYPGTRITSAPATVSLTIAPGPPTAAAVTGVSVNGNPITIQLAGASTVTGQFIIFSILTRPTQGTITAVNQATGTVIYTPNAGAQGIDSFQYATVNIGAPASGLTSPPATVTVDLIAPALTVVKTVQWQSIKVPRKKPRMDVVVTFSGAVDAGTAQSLNDYVLIAAGKKGTFGGPGSKRVPLLPPVYNAATHTVLLTPRSNVPNQLLRLTITAAQPIAAVGRPINGQFFQLSSP